MTDTITIPLNKLVPWDGNVRKTGAADGIAELAASIAAHGLLQSLVVRPVAKGRKRGKYEIIAGRRRYLALMALAKAGTLTKDHPVVCQLADGEINASELSLAENVVRAPMHPADQFEAFRTVIESGAGIADVAARFGVTENLVAKRLKLGRLSPAILDAYRNDQIGLEEAQAFAISDDHEAQERVFSELSSWSRQPHTIRRALTAEEIPASDKRVQFVGLDAYEAEGGSIRRDLFGHDGGGYVQDNALLDRLVAEKLASVATTVTAEGWRWVEVVPDLSYEDLAQFAHRYSERVALSDEDQAELDKLTGQYDELVDTDDEPEIEALTQIEQRIDELTAKSETWPAETLSIAGAIVSLCHNGGIRIERGLVRKDDERKAKAEASESEPAGPAVTLSAKLVEDLTAQKSAAIGAELIRQPDIALAAVVHALALRAFYNAYGTESCLELRLSPPNLQSTLAQPESCEALSANTQAHESLGDGWNAPLPGNPADLWTWCLERSRDELLSVLALAAAHAVNAVQRKSDRPDSPRLSHGHALAHALNLDMSAWFTPKAENFFTRISRTAILAAIDEAKGGHGPALERMKKAELASRAEDIVAGTGWLPAPLRIADVEDEGIESGELPEAAE